MATKVTTVAAIVLAIICLVLAFIVAVTLPKQNARIRAQQKIIENYEKEKNNLIEQIDQTKQTLALATTFNSTLQIDTTPSAARIFLSGNELGTSPLRVEGLPAGSHRMRIVLDGYDPVEFDVVLPEKDMADLGTITLKRSLGDLTLGALSPDTKYTLYNSSGEPVAEGRLPAVINDLPTGLYNVLLEHQGHRREDQVEVKSGSQNIYKLGFQMATLTVESQPPGAHIDYNNTPLGVTPLISVPVPAGTAQLTLKAKGYLPETVELTMEPNKHRTITASLKPQPGPPPGKNFTNSAGMEMVWHPAGFWVARYEVTQYIFQKITDTNPSTFRGSNMPVETLTWSAAQDFTRRLNTHEKENDMLPLGYRYSLPGEKHWNAFAGDVPRPIVGGDAAASPRPVGGQPNVFGLHNVHDNVWEWSADIPPTDPLKRIALGGGWSTFYNGLEAQRTRTVQPRDMASPAIGFRVVLIPE